MSSSHAWSMFFRPTLLCALLLAVCSGLAIAADLTVSWTDNSGGLASFRLERRGSTESAFNTIADLSARTTTYRDTNVVAGAMYCYRVQAYYFSTESPFSNEACGSPIASTYTISVSKAGTGAGIVTSTPAGIQCGSDCAASFPSGSAVTLTATPASGSTFSGWSGGCTGTGSCIIASNASVAVTAQFSTLVDLTVSTSGRGVVASSPVGIRCGTTCSQSFASGSRVTLTATPANGFQFAGWSGGCSGTTTTCTVQLAARTSVAAMFRNAGGNIGGVGRR